MTAAADLGAGGTAGHGIAALRERIASGALSHEALVTQALDGAAAAPARYVFTRLYADAALAAARHADAARRAGVALPVLAGLPVTVKDLYDVAGETTLAGSVVCEGEPAAVADDRDLSKSLAALDELTEILKIGNVYDFQRSGASA